MKRFILAITCVLFLIVIIYSFNMESRSGKLIHEGVPSKNAALNFEAYRCYRINRAGKRIPTCCNIRSSRGKTNFFYYDKPFPWQNDSCSKDKTGLPE